MKTRLLLVMAVLLSCCSPAVRAQNIEGQIIAAQYGKWRVPAVPQPTTGNAFSFVAAACTQIAGNASFQAFQVGTPIEIFDVDPALNEVVTPSAVSATNQGCSITVTPANVHHSFSLGSATGGLQEALNANLPSTQANMIVLTKAWYDQGGTSSIITSTVQGSTLLNLVDDTKSPYDWYQWNGSHYAKVSIGGGNPGSPALSLQFANAAGTGFQGSAQLLYDPATETLTDKANVVINAVSSIPRAAYDVMDTRPAFKGGLAAAIAGTSGFTPSQVVQAVADYAECQDITGASAGFTKGFIRLPQGINISLSGVKIWNGQSIGGDTNTSGPNLINDGVSQIIVSHHIAGDTIVCNGTTYTPGNSGNTYIHNFGISGHGTPSTLTDIGILMNCESCAVENIRGVSNAFGGPGILLTGTSAFGRNLGGDGSQIQGCKTFTGGFLPVSGFTLGNGSCGSVQNNALDGGASYVYVSDGQVTAPNHAAGPCYPLCAAFVAAGNGTYNDHIFAQLSDIGALGSGFNNKIEVFRGDFFSREGIKLQTGLIVHDVMIDSACTDKALQANYIAGIATGCFPIDSAASANISQFSVFNNSGIFDQSYNQAWVHDGTTGASGTSGLYSLFTYQGNPSNTTQNDWFIAGEDNSPAAARVVYPAMPPVAISAGSTINASGLTAVALYNNVTITSIIGGSAGQRLTIVGNGTIAQGSQIFNLNGLDTTIVCTSGDGRSCPTALEYVATAGNLWVQISGPPNQTPNHVNFAGNPTVTSPSLVHVIGNYQAGQTPATLLTPALQLHGPAAPSGHYSFIQKATFADGSYVSSDQVDTTTDLTAQAAGEVFTITVPQAVSYDLYLVANTTTSGLPLGKYPTLGPTATQWDGPTTIAAGGDGSSSTTWPAASDNYTGIYYGPFGFQVNTSATQPTCNVLRRGLQWEVQGSGATPDVHKICEYNGASYAWVTH